MADALGNAGCRIDSHQLRVLHCRPRLAHEVIVEVRELLEPRRLDPRGAVGGCTTRF
jgi:hypothetical protein